MITRLNLPALADPRDPFRQLEAVDAALCRLRLAVRQRDDDIEHMELERLARAVLIWRQTLETLCQQAAKPAPPKRSSHVPDSRR